MWAGLRDLNPMGQRKCSDYYPDIPFPCNSLDSSRCKSVPVEERSTRLDQLQKQNMTAVAAFGQTEYLGLPLLDHGLESHDNQRS
jgi:hypothetical protein